MEDPTTQTTNPQTSIPVEISRSGDLLNKKALLVLLAISLFIFGGVSGALIRDNFSSDLGAVQQDEPEVTDVPSPTEPVATATVVVTTEAVKDPVEESVATNVKVYMFSFDKFNEVGNADYTVAVDRATTRADVATFVVEQIITGPTAQEKSQSLQDTFGEGNQVWFIDDSNCGGKDFTVSISDKVADVQFCRQTMTAGDMSGFIVQDQIQNSLKQFSTIDKVRVLNVNGDCFDDMSGSTPAECVY